MKNYKNLVPIILVGLFVLGIYMKYDTNATKINEYNTYLSQARSYKELGINVDAEACYLAALKVKPNIELYIEIGEFYKSINTRTSINWGKDILSEYPEDVIGYEFLLRIYKDEEMYSDFFEVYSTMTKRGLQSEVINEYVSALRKEYFFASGKYDDVSYYAGGLCAVKDEGYWMYVDQIGGQMTQKDYITAGFFFDGVAPISTKIGDIYYINSSGEKKHMVLKDDIEILGCYDDALCTIYNGKTWGVYDLEGKLKFGEYSNISSLSNGVIAVENEGKWSLLDTEGNRLISDDFEDIKQDEKGVVYRNSRLFVKENSKYYMIDVEGNKITKDDYEDVKIFYGDGYAAVKQNGQWGFVNADGEIVIKPQFEDARSFSNGYAAVKLNGQWGFIDADGEFLIECKFGDTRDFTSSGSVFVKLSGEWRLIRMYMMNY